MSFFVVFAAILVIIDQLVKYWALNRLQLMQTLPIWENVFHLTYVENRGAAFSMLSGQVSQWFFVGLAVVITIAILLLLYKKVLQTKLGEWSLLLIAAGAVGNAIDRAIHGFVVDLFDFRLINFAIFNVADIYICVGGALFVIYMLFQHKDKEELAAMTEETPNHE